MTLAKDKTMQTVKLTVTTLDLATVKTAIASMESLGFSLCEIIYRGHCETVKKYKGFNETCFCHSGVRVKLMSLKRSNFNACIDGEDMQVYPVYDSDKRSPQWDLEFVGSKITIDVR
jgi:hypothetical protein